MYCGCAEEYARDEWGVDLTPLKTGHPTLPFMGDSGCVVPVHLRPLCTIHTCEIAANGFKRGDTEWTEKYFELRERIEELEEIRLTQKGEIQMKIRLLVETGFAGCDYVDFTDLPDDWETMTEKEQQKYLDEAARDYMTNYINWCAYVVDDDVEE
jgi:hypothetical protein